MDPFASESAVYQSLLAVDRRDTAAVAIKRIDLGFELTLRQA
jgi:hypothetical protein